MKYTKIVDGRLAYPTAAEFQGIPNWSMHDGQLRKHGYRPIEELQSLYQDDFDKAAQGVQMAQPGHVPVQEVRWAQPPRVPAQGVRGAQPPRVPAQGVRGAQPPVVRKEAETTALIACHYGGHSDLRRDATLRAVAAWNAQETHPDEAVFLELVCPGQSPCFARADFPSWLQYIRIYGKERNRNLFQKEALWNLGAKLTGADKILFLDADCMPIDTTDYFRRIFDAVVPGTVVHACFKLVQEGYAEDYLGEMYSVLAPFDRTPGNRYRFPGIGYGMTRQDYHDRDGFNPFSIPGSGDVIFIWETFPDIRQPMGSARRFHESLVRPNRPALKHVALEDTVLQHNYHGAKIDRAYVWSREAVLLFGLPTAYCHIDSSGLLAWNDPDFILKDILMQKTRMHTKDDLYSLVCEVVKNRLDRQERNQKQGEGHYDRRDFNQFD